MSDDKSPREFCIRHVVSEQGGSAQSVHSGPSPVRNEIIHVIERTAYDALAERYASLQAADKENWATMDRYRGEINRLATELAEVQVCNARIFSDAGRLTEERDRLEAELAECHATIDQAAHKIESWHRKWSTENQARITAEQERDAARAEVERLHEAELDRTYERNVAVKERDALRAQAEALVAALGEIEQACNDSAVVCRTCGDEETLQDADVAYIARQALAAWRGENA